MRQGFENIEVLYSQVLKTKLEASGTVTFEICTKDK